MERRTQIREPRTLVVGDLLEAGLLSQEELTETGAAVADQLAASIDRNGCGNLKSLRPRVGARSRPGNSNANRAVSIATCKPRRPS